MTNVFNMLDYLLTNINYTVAQAQKPKRQCDLISSQPASPIYMTCFFEISPTWTSKYLSRLFPVSPNFAVIQQYKTRLVHQTSFKYPFVFLVNTTYEKIYIWKLQKKPSKSKLKLLKQEVPLNYFLSEYYYWLIFRFTLTTLITYLLFKC